MSDHIAAVCMNGHARNSMLTTPFFSEPYCELCGALVITCCPKCNRPIKGGIRKHGLRGIAIKAAVILSRMRSALSVD